MSDGKELNHCCDAMRNYLRLCPPVIEYAEPFNEYLLPIYDGDPDERFVGGSGIVIVYCPWCGTRLPKSTRDEVGEDYFARHPESL